MKRLSGGDYDGDTVCISNDSQLMSIIRDTKDGIADVVQDRQARLKNMYPET